MRKSEKAAVHGAADLQAQLSEAWNQQLGRSGETYGRLFAAMRDEFTGFVQRRVDANMATMREWSECRSLNDVLALQQRWVQSAVEHYVDQGNRVIETCRLAATDIAEAAQPKPEQEKPAAERKPAAQRSAGIGNQGSGLALPKIPLPQVGGGSGWGLFSQAAASRAEPTPPPNLPRLGGGDLNCAIPFTSYPATRTRPARSRSRCARNGACRARRTRSRRP